MILISSEKEFLTNSNFEKSTVRELGPGKREVLYLLFVVLETVCADMLNF